MEPGSSVAVFLPLFTAIIVIMQQRKRKQRIAILKLKRKKGELIMSVDAFRRHVGRRCQIITILEKKISGIIKIVEGNWIEVQTNRNIELVNIEFIERLRVLSN